ncbi:hypothetical protein DV738_g1121, partial [Chaetothyriales sp. CBS 135597]
MPSFEDDDERDLPGSPDGSSDDDGDDTMRDIDDDNADQDGDGDGDMDNEDESGDSENEDNNGEPDSATGQVSTQAGGTQQESARTAEQSAVRIEMLTAESYDIVPTIAAPQSTSVNATCATWDARWVFTGGSDGYIRKFNWVESVNNKLALTVAQRHPFVDSVVKAGVLMSYWENWDTKARSMGAQESTQVISPVYSLACHSQGLWLLSGTASGAIRLQSVRHDEGKQIALLRQHTSAVSVLSLSSDERALLSGSWDKTVLDWDLETGQVKTAFASSAGQISSIESRPISSLPVPAESGEIAFTNGVGRTYGDNMANGVSSRAQSQGPVDQPSPASRDSLFGGDEGDDDLFGESVGAALANGAGDAFGEDDDEMARALADGPPVSSLDDQIMADASDGLQPVQPPQPEPTQSILGFDEVLPNGDRRASEQGLANGLPHADDMEGISQGANNEPDAPVTSDSTFMATSIDGAIRVWDRRQPNPVARVMPRNTPPWCMSACWSPDGNYIFAGRRNNTVEEYDLRKGLKEPARVFKFPNGSGAVTSVKAMPNGRHLICASYDILRLYDLKESPTSRSTVPFLIVPGHRTGVISQLYIDPSCRFMLSTGGNRGWDGSSTEVLLGNYLSAPKLVSVIECSGKPFTEYGVQDLGTSATKSKICSVKIESKTGQVFQILVKPTSPFPFDENETGVLDKARQRCEPTTTSSSSSSLSPNPTTASSGQYPPFGLSVAVYIDGKQRPECIYNLTLDPSDKYYKPHGMKLRGRLEANEEASTDSAASNADPSRLLFKVKGWKWNTHGNIEDLMSNCNLNAVETQAAANNNNTKTAEEIAFDDLSNTFSQAAGMANTKTTYDKAGVIRVVIKRIVILGPSRIRRLPGGNAAAPTNQAGGSNDQDGKETTSKQSFNSGDDHDDHDHDRDGIEHITGTAESSYTVNLSFLAWARYKQHEDFFAEFRFQYMPRHKLVKLGLCSEDGTPTTFPAPSLLPAGPATAESPDGSGSGSTNNSGKRDFEQMDAGDDSSGSGGGASD